MTTRAREVKEERRPRSPGHRAQRTAAQTAKDVLAPPAITMRPKAGPPSRWPTSLACPPSGGGIWPVERENLMASVLGRPSDALGAGGVPDHKAREAADEVATYEKDLAEIKSDVRLLNGSPAPPLPACWPCRPGCSAADASPT